MNKVKILKKYFVLLILLIICGCTKQEAYTPLRENITVEEENLGLIKTEINPVLVLEKEKVEIKIGDEKPTFTAESYSENGKVEITYDDSNVDYKKPGTYATKVTAIDETGNIKTKEVEIVIEKNTSAQRSHENSLEGGSTKSDNSKGQIVTGYGTFNTEEEAIAAFCALPNIDYTHPTAYARNCQ